MQNKNKKNLRVLMSGGGTGGHIFPAIAIAQEIQKQHPNAEFLFIGAKGKMEMEKVPQTGFRIEGLNIAGFNRSHLLANLKLPFKIISSLLKARQIIKNFNPDFAVGTGGFASGPALFVASQMGIPIFIQEQNSLPGKTNIFLSKRAKAVFTAYPDMEKFFGNTKTLFLGNPIRKNIITDLIDTATAKEKLGLDKSKLTILSIGGSLGSKTLNDAWDTYAEKLIEKDYQLIWQTGKNYNCQSPIANYELLKSEFISDMPLAYSATDVIVSRAGAIAISELAVVGKPILLVPFPFAAEDHQTKNALNLVQKNASKMVKDTEMKEKFWDTLMEICENETLRQEMSENLKLFAKPKATEEIVEEILRLL
ncbi:MAG: undecaprenyldiphospho-muramoylpentapeptide beta-N-acetylglucosaminyltransferase [Flavobacteriaceae bacterium]|nr:undecaprenyldiphospho-muramoylpentapeptide beta-N-acetylglucosaminyltransferase [Flavobacteriaceae bacterium]